MRQVMKYVLDDWRAKEPTEVIVFDNNVLSPPEIDAIVRGPMPILLQGGADVLKQIANNGDALAAASVVLPHKYAVVFQIGGPQPLIDIWIVDFVFIDIYLANRLVH